MIAVADSAQETSGIDIWFSNSLVATYEFYAVVCGLYAASRCLL